MSLRPRRPWLPGCLLLAAGLAGCAHSTAVAVDPAAIEQARREERQKIMSDYWYDQTLAPGGDVRPATPPPLAYPAGTYSGINYGPRLAPDPSLAEPVR